MLDHNHNSCQYHSSFTNTSHDLLTSISSTLHLQSNFETLYPTRQRSEYGPKREHTNINVIYEHIREKGQSTTTVDTSKRPPNTINYTTTIHDEKSSVYDLSILTGNSDFVRTHRSRSNFNKVSEQIVVREDMTDKGIKNDAKHKKSYIIVLTPIMI